MNIYTYTLLIMIVGIIIGMIVGRVSIVNRALSRLNIIIKNNTKKLWYIYNVIIIFDLITIPILLFMGIVIEPDISNIISVLCLFFTFLTTSIFGLKTNKIYKGMDDIIDQLKCINENTKAD